MATLINISTTSSILIRRRRASQSRRTAESVVYDVCTLFHQTKKHTIFLFLFFSRTDTRTQLAHVLFSWSAARGLSAQRKTDIDIDFEYTISSAAQCTDQYNNIKIIFTSIAAFTCTAKHSSNMYAYSAWKLQFNTVSLDWLNRAQLHYVAI